MALRTTVALERELDRVLAAEVHLHHHHLSRHALRLQRGTDHELARQRRQSSGAMHPHACRTVRHTQGIHAVQLMLPRLPCVPDTHSFLCLSGGLTQPVKVQCVCVCVCSCQAKGMQFS